MSLGLSEFVIVFFLFSVLGWCMEVILKMIELHRFVNRGFLIGPYCPIYGFGVVFIIVILQDILHLNTGIFSTFAGGFIVCGILEYFVSYIMEKRYHARWWDYSTKPFNIHGRVWIGNLILFGLAAFVILQIIYPVIRLGLNAISEPVKWVISILIVILMTGDVILSRLAMHVIRDEIDGTQADDSEEISTKVHMALKNRSLFVARLERAYPTMKVSPSVLKEKILEAELRAKQALKDMDEAIDEKKYEMYKTVSEKAETIGRTMSDVTDMDTEEFKQYIGEVKEDMKDAFDEKKQEVYKSVSSKAESIGKTISEVSDKKSEYLEEVKESLMDKKENLLNRKKEDRHDS